MASLFLVTRHFDLRHSPEGLAFHIAAVLNNPECPAGLYNALAEQVADISSGAVVDTAQSIALQLRARKAREAARVA